MDPDTDPYPDTVLDPDMVPDLDMVPDPDLNQLQLDLASVWLGLASARAWAELSNRL